MDRVGIVIPSSNMVIENLLQAPSGFLPKDRRFHVAEACRTEPAARLSVNLLDSVALTFEEVPP